MIDYSMLSHMCYMDITCICCNYFYPYRCPKLVCQYASGLGPCTSTTLWPRTLPPRGYVAYIIVFSHFYETCCPYRPSLLKPKNHLRRQSKYLMKQRLGYVRWRKALPVCRPSMKSVWLRNKSWEINVNCVLPD